MKRSFSSLTIGTLLLAGLLGVGASSAYGDWTNVWSDEFNGTSVDLTKWTYDIGNGSNNPGWGNQELEYYTSRTNNAYVTNGVLHIVARNESYMGFQYTSARMKTQGHFAKKYGRFEFRASLPHGQGYWPALWLMPRDSVYGGWAASGEIDIMENKGSSYNVIGGTDIFGGPWPNQVYDSTSYTVPSAVTNFHVYALEWSTNSLKWYVDGDLYKTSTSWNSTGGSYPAPFDQFFYIIMNVAIGGNYGGNPDGTTVFPGEMDVDYVRVYDLVVPTVPPTTPTGLTATAGGASVALNWSNSPSATSYNVKRSSVSGGPYTQIANPTDPTYNDTGVINCATYYYVVSATNSLGESTNSVEASASVGAYGLAVNSGGSAASPFVADAYVTGGTVASPTGNPIITTGVTNPAPQAVYQSERYGAMTYTFSGLTTGAVYKVRLHEAEIYFTAANKRKFNVSINGTQVLTNYDVFAAAGGQYRAVVPEFMIAPNGSGQIVVQFTAGSVDLPRSSGIEIILPAPAAPTGLGATPGDAQVALSWNSVTGANSYNVKRATSGVGPFGVVTNVTGVACTDTGLTNGTTYYYVVSTVIGGCESTNSAPVSATPVSELTPFEQWQVQYFGSTNNSSAAPDADADGTGQNNQFKYIAGLDPTNPASVFILDVAGVIGQPTQLNLIFSPVVPGRTYSPQFKTDFVTGMWTQLISYAGPVTNGNQVTITDLNAAASNKFYRIDISLP